MFVLVGDYTHVSAMSSFDCMRALGEYGPHRSLWRTLMSGSARRLESIYYLDGVGLSSPERRCPICDTCIAGDHLAGKPHCKRVQGRLRAHGGDYTALDRVLDESWIFLPTRSLYVNVASGAFVAADPSAPLSVPTPSAATVETQTATHAATRPAPPPPPRQSPDRTLSPESPQAIHHVGHSDHVMRCVICCDSQRDAVFLPCGHLIACQPCAEQSTASTGRCPICRSGVSSTVRIYLS